MLPLFGNDMSLTQDKHMKAKKRQLERVRRQKINERLEKLKVIVMKHLGNDVGFYPPMEKADILELAIRCLEGKEETNKENADRKPLEHLQNNTTSPIRKLETTPTRLKSLNTKKTIIMAKPDPNDYSSVGGQFRAEFKPLLEHPIRSFSATNECADATGMDQLNQSEDLSKHSIWRPWTEYR